MKHITLLLLSLFLISCSGENCTSADWAGTYIGTFTCDEIVQVYTTVITEGPTESTIIADGEQVTVDGCNYSLTDTTLEIDGESVTFSGDYTLDGNLLSGTGFITSGGSTITCTLSATK